MPNGTCAVCLSPIERPPGQRGRARKYHRECDPHGRRHEPLGPRECKRCDATFQPKGEGNVYCSPECQGYQPRVNSPRVCEFSQCGQTFQPKTANARSCSPGHARKAWAERNPERELEGKRARYHKRRALRKGAATGERVETLAIAERDEWTCHLCDTEIPRDASWPAPLSLSLDHVIPLSKGGIHDPSNVKAAHLRCNVAKGDRLAA